MQNGTATLENNLAFSPKVKYPYTREIKIYIHTKTCIAHITGLIVCVAGFCFVIIGTILLFKHQPKRTNRYY